MNRMLQACLLSPSNSKAVPLTSFFKTLLVGAHGSSSSQVTQILQGPVKVSSSRNSYYGFRTFCTAKDLSTKKCVPCNAKDLRPMTEQAANELIPEVPGWSLVNEGGTLKLNRSWKVKSFTKGLELFQAVADIAEAEELCTKFMDLKLLLAITCCSMRSDAYPIFTKQGYENLRKATGSIVCANCLQLLGFSHHPDLHLVGWNNVTIEIWTHSIGGLSENDFILASKISALDLHHLLRRKATI